MTLKQFFQKIRGATSYAWNGFTGFLGRHKYAIGVSLLALVAGAALAASLVFFFPATIGTLIGLTAALPFIGAPVAAFLSSIGLVGAAAVIGGAAAAVGMAAGAVGYGVVQTLRFIGNVVIGAYKGARNEVVGEPEEPATQQGLEDLEAHVNANTDAKATTINARIQAAENGAHNDAVALSRQLNAFKADMEKDILAMLNEQTRVQASETQRLIDAGLRDVTRHFDAVTVSAAAAKPAKPAKPASSSDSSSSSSDSDDEKEKAAAKSRRRAPVVQFPTSSTSSTTPHGGNPFNTDARAPATQSVFTSGFTFHTPATTTTTTPAPAPADADADASVVTGMGAK